MESLFTLNSPLCTSKVQPRWMKSKKSTTCQISNTDRFIPSRSCFDAERSNFYLSQNSGSESQSNTSAASRQLGYDRELASCLLDQANSEESFRASFSDENSNSNSGRQSGYGCSFNGTSSTNSTSTSTSNTRILAFRQKAPEKRREDLRHLISAKAGFRNGCYNGSSSINGVSGASSGARRRYISPTPERILDAPEMLDDYYLNLLDWSCQNVLAVALKSTVYLWNASSGTVDELLQLPEESDYVSSVSWSQDGYYLSVGTSDAQVQLWDMETKTKVRTMRGHSARVGALSWNQHVLSSGCRDGSIYNNDVRVAQHHVGSLLGHSQEVCGLKWSPDGSQLASGGNDNLLCIWDKNNSSSNPRFSLSHHRAAVKALAWCPWQPHLLASGGGSYDRCIKFWNTLSGTCVSSLDTGSQVCSLLWSPHHKEIVSSHGYADNQLSVWRYPSMSKVTDLYGHSSRVLQLAMSPDGQTVVSGAADENLKFWKIFDPPTSQSSNLMQSTTLTSQKSPASKLESKLRKVIR